MYTINHERKNFDLPLPSNHVFGDLLSPKERTYLVENSIVRQFSVDETLCEQNKVENLAYVILTGEVQVTELAGDKIIALGVLQAGDLVGEIGALFTVPRIATVAAKKPTVVLEIPAQTFQDLINKTPMLHGAVYQRLYERSLETALCSVPAFGQLSHHVLPELSHLLQCWSAKHH